MIERSANTGHWRAKLLRPRVRCELEQIGGCLGRLEVAHLNEEPKDNRLENLMVLCKAHHTLVDNGKIDVNAPAMPVYYIDRSGKRRYIEAPTIRKERRSRYGSARLS